MPPIEALRAWLLLFVDYIAAKQLIAPALNALLGDPKKVFEASYARMWEAIRALVKRAIKSGDIREDLDAIDLLRALMASPTWPPVRTGSRVPEDSSTSSSPGHARPNRPKAFGLDRKRASMLASGHA